VVCKSVRGRVHSAKDALAELENEPDDEAEVETSEPATAASTEKDGTENQPSLAERLAALQAESPGGDLDDADFHNLLSSYDFAAMPGASDPRDQLGELAARVATALSSVDDEAAVHLLDQLMSDDPQIDCEDDIQASLNAVLSRGAPAA